MIDFIVYEQSNPAEAKKKQGARAFMDILAFKVYKKQQNIYNY